MIRKAKAVWRGTGRDGSGGLSTDSGVLAETPYSFKTRFDSEKGELVAQLAANPAAAALTSVPGILLLPGAVLIKSGDEVIGSIGVGGAPSGLVDEGCAKAGVERIASSVK